MKNAKSTILHPVMLCALTGGMACTAHADLPGGLTVDARQCVGAMTHDADAGLGVVERGLWSGSDDPALAMDAATQNAAAPAVSFAADQIVHELPASPGSAGLFLSAVLSVGAWHLVRTARQVTFNLPAWYHSGGPHQVGNAVPYLPNERLSAIFGPVVAVLQSTLAQRAGCRRCPQILARRPVVVAIPRAPPAWILAART